ncbi:MAG TPA: hypothetical protein PKJ81_03950, partial [Bacteroidales bacterium]|nr:hypothetical protein [Bacteroidales bacterium]
ALAALLVSKLLKFPIHENAAPARQKVIKRYVTLIIILTLIPSIFLGNRLVQQERFIEKSKKYIDNVRVIDDKYLLDYSIDPQKKVINLIYGGTTLDEKDKELIASRLQNFDLKAEVVIKQGFAIDQKEYQEKEKLILQISSLEAELNKQNAIIDSIKSRPLLAKNLINELTIINSNIISCAIADTYIFKADNSLDSTTVLLVGIANDDMPKNEKERIISWLKARLQNEKIVVFFSANLK